MNYSFITGLKKAVIQVAIFAVPAILSATTIGNLTIAQLITHYLPISGTLTVSAVISLLLNYLKNKDNTSNITSTIGNLPVK